MKPVSTTGKRIFQALREKNISQAELGRRIELARTTISSYVHDQNTPNRITIEAIAKELGVSADWLAGYDVEKLPSSFYFEETVIPIEQIILIPVVGSVSAGNGLLAADNIESYEPLLNSNIHGNSENYFFVKVQGDSMAPRIEQGDLALIKKASSVESGHLAIVLVDDMDGVIKKIKYGLDYVELVSFNHYYPPRRFERQETDRIQIIGEVVEIKRKFA